MTRDVSRCPDPEVLAAFVAGSLSGDELEMVADHLRECEDCRIIVAEAARVDRDAEPAPSPFAATGPVARRSPWWLAAAAAALVGIVAVTAVRRSPARSEIEILVAAAPRDGRFIEPRLRGGFPWAPLRPVQRGAGGDADAGQMKLVGAAGTVLERTAGDPSVRAQHATAVAHLLAGRAAQAGELLAKTARSGGDAPLWSDLAAAHYTAAMETNNPALLADALAAADTALRADPELGEALFNRALIIERLGLREQARAAWQRYLAHDRTSAWAREAEKHVAGLAPAASFKDELNRSYRRLLSDRAAAAALARRFPHEARVWGETEILSRWAEAWQASRPDAGRHLMVAQAFGEELALSSGERLLQHAVSAIDRASAAQKDTLAVAHLQFRTAQRTYRGGAPADAERLFTAAAAAFEQAGSPVALLAKYFAANTQYDQGRIEESGVRLEELRASAPAEFLAYRAQLEWQLGLVRASRASWGGAMEALTTSIATFEQLHDTAYATAVREILAEVFDRIGDSRSAWHHRIAVLRELGHSTTPKLLVTLDSAARGALLDRNWPVSLSLLDLELEAAEGSGDEMLYAQTLLLRARVNGRLGRHDSATRDLARAGAVIGRIDDASYRERADADRLTVEGLLTTSPNRAVPLLTRAIEFNGTKGRRMLLPDLHLHRGRALNQLGRREAAAADFEAGIVELETQRASIGAGDGRWGMFGTAEELFDEAVGLAISRGDDAGAFAYSERARARELLESMNASSSRAVDAVAADTVLVEYASLPSRLLIFLVQGGRVRAVEQQVARSALEEEVALLRDSAQARDSARFRRHSATLYSHLIAPLTGFLSDRKVVFVPDGTLRSVPFAALVDVSGAYLIERHAIAVAPSAAVYARLTRGAQASGAESNVLVVEGPVAVTGQLGHLRSTEREAGAVAAMYRHADRIPSARADEVVFGGRAAAANVIHFAGHAVDEVGLYPALVTSRGEGSDGRLDVREIAALQLRRTRVVVLAACSTAHGDERAGEGNISIARAFLAAGVPSVVATLWRIDDDPAADFFPRLHRHLARGVSPAEALRLAQLESIQSRGAPPAMWAAVQVIGS